METLPPRARLRVALAGRGAPLPPSRFRGTVAGLVDEAILPALLPAHQGRRLIAHPSEDFESLGAGGLLWLHLLLGHGLVGLQELPRVLPVLPRSRPVALGVPHLEQQGWEVLGLLGDDAPAPHVLGVLPLPPALPAACREAVRAHAAWRLSQLYGRLPVAPVWRDGPEASEAAGRERLQFRTPRSSAGPSSRTLVALHLVDGDLDSAVDRADGYFETGPWPVESEQAQTVRFLALHGRKSRLSHRQGTVRAVRAHPEGGVSFEVSVDPTPVIWRGGGWSLGKVWSDGRNGDGSK